MRGKRKLAEFCARYVWITPADAGKTTKLDINNSTPWDHPRGCGENAETGIYRCNDEGSPPLMRGKRKPNGFQRQIYRITPADAGKTVYNRMGKIQNKDHPRGCGENNSHMCKFTVGIGSPPRMRGKHHQLIIPAQHNRITPADAGKTKTNEQQKSKT